MGFIGSLCKQLGKRYGVMARMTLSYDFYFFSRFSHGAFGYLHQGFKKGRCTFNPLKKRTCCCENTHVEFAADAATLLMYHKLKDNMADNGFFHSLPARLLLPFASAAKKKAGQSLSGAGRSYTDLYGQAGGVGDFQNGVPRRRCRAERDDAGLSGEDGSRG